MKKIVLIGLLFLSLNIPVATWAQNDREVRKAGREEFFKFRREFMTEQIGLTEQESEAFFALYDKMEKEKWMIEKETRGLARKLAESEVAPTNLEYEKAAEALLERDEKIARIEREYYEKFKTILSSEKLFKFKHAQMRLPHAMMKHKEGHKKGERK